MTTSLKRLLFALLAVYVVWLILAYRYHFLDGVNLLVHEAGHVIFGLLGEGPAALGGTILQLAFPLAFVLYFANRGRRFEAAVCGVWVAESAMYTAVYIADAQAQELPLVGGGRHDWNWMLDSLGLLEWAEPLGLVVHWLASLGALAALWVMAREAELTGRPA